jgi:hypothetical protein
MKKLLQAAGVAGLVLLGAVGCSNCCGSRTTSAAAPCANGQCATATPMPGRAMASGMTGTASPTTMTTTAGKPPMLPVNQMPATGSMTTVGGSGNPMLIPQQ